MKDIRIHLDLESAVQKSSTHPLHVFDTTAAELIHPANPLIVGSSHEKDLALAGGNDDCVLLGLLRRLGGGADPHGRAECQALGDHP